MGVKRSLPSHLVLRVKEATPYISLQRDWMAMQKHGEYGMFAERVENRKVCITHLCLMLVDNLDSL
jgi:hypothetical protein